MAKRSSGIERAAKLFKAFNGREPDFVDTVHLKDYKEVMLIGPVLAVEYLADDGHGYRHKFKHKSRPVLAVSPDGKQLFLLEGHYEFTDRGIVDK